MRRSTNTAENKAPARRARLTVERVGIEELLLDPGNVRVHPEENLDAIRASLARFEQYKPIVVDRDGIVRAGNGTLMAAKRLGWTEIDVVRSDLSKTELAALSIADNRTTDLSHFDEPGLHKMLVALQEDGFSLEDLGFDEFDLQELIDEDLIGGLSDPDDVPEPPDEATTKLGDLWKLGDHRLLCGDSSKVEDLDRLLGGAKIQLVNTDPPYNVKVEPRSNNAIAAGLSSFANDAAAKRLRSGQGNAAMDVALGKSAKPTNKKLRAKDRPLANDFVTDGEFDRLLGAWFGNISRVLEPGRSFYIWGGYANCGNYPPVLKRSRLYFSQAIIWVKEHPVLTRKDFMGNHEWCFYGWREGAGHDFFGPNNATDVWHVKKVNPQSMVHLTEKPVELAVRAMQFSSRAGERVLDLFGGSGSTLIAAEQTGRRGYLVELDPLYCDVIIERWEKFSGRKAERLNQPK
jgi:DNA modification methylase